MSEREATALQVLAEGFSPPLVGLCVVAGVVLALAGRERPPVDPDPAPPPRTTDALGVDDPGASPAAPGDEGDPPGPATPAEVAALLDAGDFARAERRARAAGLDLLAERAHLLEVLTRGVKPGPLAGAAQVVRVTTVEGEALIGVVASEAADRVTLLLRDGREQTLPRAQVRQREALAPEAARRALDEALRRDRATLGPRPPGLALHRLAHHALAADLRGLGGRLLLEALRTPEGQVIVDMFGVGDVDRLQAARRRLAEAPAPPPDPGEETPGPIAALPEPSPAPATPAPTIPAPVTPPPRPQPPPEPERPRQVDREAIHAHPSWRAADTAYRTGLQLYRSAFDAPEGAAAPSIRAAMAQFRQAQDLLDRLIRELADAADSYDVERRAVELNALVLDCTKRLGTH
ncbi:MAG: hypothetical protein M9894_08360 [Planctomycetes bacterium]|nr:hypothetical protein [Planctomycetota bacterium]